MLIVLPFLFFRCLEMRKNKWAFFGFLQDLFVCSLSTLFLPWFCWVPISCFCSLHWYLCYRFDLPLTFSLLRSARDLPAFADSLRHLKVYRPLLLGASLLTLSWIHYSPSPFWLPFIAGVGGLFYRGKCPHLFLQVRWRRASPNRVKHHWNFPNEESDLLNSDYSLLRKTRAFLGKKRFEFKGERPNVVFVFLESFRAKNVGCLGSQIPASPHFDAWAKKGSLFKRFCASGTQTYRAFLSAFFGIQPTLDTLSLQSYGEIPLIGLPEILKEKGYKTALMQGGAASFDWTYPFFTAHGIDTIWGKEEIASSFSTSWGVSDEALFEAAANWMTQQKEPYFLSLFTISNHHPWEPPPGWHFPSDPSLPNHYRRFLQTFSYTDHALGKFLDRSFSPNTLFFILGDHGQGMGERGGAIELHNDLYQENIHVPLLILGNGIEPCAIDTPASSVDLLPTVLDLLNLDAIHHSVGKSLRREIDTPVFFSHQNHRGCLKEERKWILSPKGEEQYNLKLDSGETRNLGSAPDLKKETDAYFAAIEELFEKKQWAPKQKIPFERKATGSEEEWITTASLPCPRIDLSKSSYSDRAVEALNSSLLHELDLSHSLFTDRSLKWIGNHCPKLRILHLSYSPLFTEAAIEETLGKCQELRALYLEGNPDLQDLNSSLPYLNALHTLGSPSIRQLIRNSLQLLFLSATLEDSPLDFPQQKLQYLQLAEGQSVTDEMAQAFCSQNPDLAILSLDSFPLLTRLPRIPNLKRLKIANCPHLVNLSGYSHLEEVSILGCPHIAAEQLAHLPPCSLLFNGKLQGEEVQMLASAGITVY